MRIRNDPYAWISSWKARMCRRGHLYFFVVFVASLSPQISAEQIFTNEFAIQLAMDNDNASRVAERHGFINKGQIGGLGGYYLFEHHAINKRSLEASHDHHNLLKNDPDVLWFEQQHVKHRVKRDVFSRHASFPEYPDPLYEDQWFLHGGGRGGFDMNVLPAWKAGYTGKGVVVTILDDGIQTNHPDLAQNYDSMASLDINGQDGDPTPQDNGDNKHGTRCAGEVAAVAFNDFCGVGIAYNASIGGVRMLDGSVTDVTEAKALSHNPDHIHIYSASWGPEDDGQTVDGPGRLAKLAFADGIRTGRHGLGSIFVWASGNGGRYGDSCNCDGYTNSIYTLSISSATQGGAMPWYLEQCSSTLATTYSSGTAPKDKSITTVDMDYSYFRDLEGNHNPDPSSLCTKSHTGTSASAPIAAGICALALEANPNLTWRDMQYLVVYTSRPEPLRNEDGWVKNGVKRLVSSKFGYGLMDAAGMVKLAKQWNTVEPQSVCETIPDINERVIPANHGGYLEVGMNTSSCSDTGNAVVYLEHVQVKVTLYFRPRGNLKIMLISPAGTPSTVLLPRPRDVQEGLFSDWPFMSVHFWGEPAAGLWKLFIINDGRSHVPQPGKLVQWSLILYGTKNKPATVNPAKRTEDYSFHQESGFFPKLFHEQDIKENMLGKCSVDKKFQAEVNGKRQCVEKCDVGQYGDTKDFICRPCDKSCLTCFGPSYDNCLSCPKKLFLSKNFCVKSCPDGFYPDSERSECVPCSAPCQTCQHRRDVCLSCIPGMFLQNSSCVATCSKANYLHKSVCKKCHSSCVSCYDETDHGCSECPENMFLLNGSCVSRCPPGFYEDRGSFCRRCPLVCETCTSNSNCLKCTDGFVQDSGICIPNADCDDGWYSHFMGPCNRCSGNCAVCKGLYSSDCIYCSESFYLLDGQCVGNCLPGFFAQGRECYKCEAKCQECVYQDFMHWCVTCEQGFYLYNGSCRSACPEGFYADNDGYCKKCNPSCMHCHGHTDHDCTSCSIGNYLFNYSCVGSCPDGYFAHKGSSECEPCYHLCRTCSDFGPAYCTTCHKSTSYIDGMCIPCLDDEYYDEYSQTCERCHDKCGRCSGPSEYDCLSCEAPLRLNESNHLCLPCCARSLPKDGKCCTCSKNLDICISSGEHPRSVDGESYDSDNLYGTVVQRNDVMLIVAVICFLAVALFVLLFSLLQARSKGWCHLCHRSTEYVRVPNHFSSNSDADSETVSLTQDLDEDDDTYEKA